MRLPSAIIADDSRTRALGRATHERRRAGEIGFVPPDCAATGGGDGGPSQACRAEIGFVPPKSALPRGGSDGGPRVACSADIGFVLPDSRQLRGGGDRGPWIAARPRRSRPLQGIERLDRALSPRERAALVAIEPHQPGGRIGGGKSFDHDLRARAADARDVDLRLGDAERGGAARLGRRIPGDPARQVGGLRRERRIREHGLAQPVTQRVARAPLLAGARARPGAARRIGAVGGEDSFVGAWGGRRTRIPPGIMCGIIECEVSTMPAPSPPLAPKSGLPDFGIKDSVEVG
jgi:hypothetical protein